VIEVHSWGIAGAVVDAGTLGRAWLGAARGGAVDVASLALTNRLVGNEEQASAFETSGGLVCTFTTPTMVAVAGAVAQISVTDGPPLGWGCPVVLPSGATVRVGRLLEGARTYLAVRGGVVSGDSGFQVGPDPGTPAASHAAARRDPSTTIRLWPGPRLDWFSESALNALHTGRFMVTDTSRVGVRLAGPVLHRVRHDELPSEGLVEGAIQVPPDGHPIVMLADHPTTGGYPVIAVVDPDDLPHVAQAAPGTDLRFTSAWFRYR
jgi:allophanate hydrolase subunit 2